MATRNEIVHFLDERLDIAAIEDDSVNGLQVQGTAQVDKVGLATDAAMAVYRRAQTLGCQMLVTHHGLIWGGLRRITGREHEHVKFLIDADLSLYAAHLPLDLHPEVGNNAELARLAGLRDCQPFGIYHGRALGLAGTLAEPTDPNSLAELWRRDIGGTPLVLPFGAGSVSSVGILSGGGSSALPEAIDKKLDCFVTGEAKHQDHHLALEAGIHVIYLGHYHSETLGVKALGRELAERFGLETEFIDEPTSV